MGRIIALDYGQKRVGIAVTDPLRIIATALTTVHSKDIFPFLNEYFSKEPVDIIVVGYPKQMNNKPSEAIKFIKPFFEKLQKTYPSIKCILFDERFTSKIALQSMIEAGSKKNDRQKKENIDKISATLLLQDFLNYLKYQSL